MPKRSNQFQRLITFVAEQVAPIGATVRESVELDEKGLEGPVSREVDILIEVNAGMAPLRIAMECRDRSRKDDIQWIDDLIGKYRNLPVNQVIAVSSSGLSGPARQKAKFHDIVTMSLEEATETNWPEKFEKLGVAIIKQHFDIKSITFITEPPIKGEIAADDKIIPKADTPASGVVEPEFVTVQDFVEDTKQVIIQQTREYVSNNFLSIYKSLADLGKDAVVERKVPTNGLVLQSGGEEYEIKAITFVLLVRTNHSKVDVQRHLLSDKALVTSAVVNTAQDLIHLTSVQVADKPEGKWFMERRMKKTRKKGE